ncbi:hypothetical protein IFM89_006688 [Coptis chinensis]|uniref:Neprosin PEP catalytic domain-containing protein n=1 Tax=Coptis chinensis TaxID=261450 RepID=A0A835IUQ2_9MAGN|nr:hypothetical protein IFM89_006688 [Coptis chinensis]
MDLKFYATFLVVALLTSHIYHPIEARRIVTGEGDLKLDEQIKILNKPAIKSIQDKGGALYDCVNIYKQPAFDHPLLKNHKIQLKPTSPTEDFTSETSSENKQSKIALESVGCPEGTVPIRRARKEDLIRAKSFIKSHSTIPQSNGYLGQHYAIVRNTNHLKIPMYGSQVKMNIINPRVTQDQSSMALMWFSNGTNEDRHEIQAGWAVAPELYGDDKTHLITYWKAGKSGCFNVQCPGYVHVSKDYPVDVVLDTSIYNGKQEELNLHIYQDQTTKNWWVTVPDNEVNLGYWPGSLISRLAEGAPNIAWGGLAKQSVTGTSPQMGYGTLPESTYTHMGYFVEIQVEPKSAGKYFGSWLPDWEKFVDSPDCYDVVDEIKQGNNGYIVTYGGAGGNCGN